MSVSDHHDDPLHFHRLVVELGFASAEDVDAAADVQAELAEHGIAAHLSDLLIDSGAITEDQRNQVLLQQEMMRVLGGIGRREPAAPDSGLTAAWVVALLAPVALVDSVLGLLVAAAALACGAAVAGASVYRWHAIGWLASIVSAAVPLGAVAGAGCLPDRFSTRLVAAVAVAAACGLVALDVPITPGVLLIGGGIALAVSRIGRRQ